MHLLCCGRESLIAMHIGVLCLTICDCVCVCVCVCNSIVTKSEKQDPSSI